MKSASPEARLPPDNILCFRLLTLNWRLIVKQGNKISILGAGNVGATIAYTLTMQGLASEIVLIDINKDKAKGEAMDIIQGTAFSASINIYAGDYQNAADSNIVIVTVGAARKPGQTRLDLTRQNVSTIQEMIPQVTKYAPNAVYVVVSNPVDILTYVITKISGLPRNHVIGSGTILDSARLRSALAEHVGLTPKNCHAYVFGEHGDSSVIPWSLATIAGMEMNKYCEAICERHNGCGKVELGMIEDDVRTAGAKVIKCKGSTHYAVALSVQRIVESIIRDTDSILTVSSLMEGQYGIHNVCLSLPCVIGAHGINKCIAPPLTKDEEEQLRASADCLRKTIDSCNFDFE